MFRSFRRLLALLEEIGLALQALSIELAGLRQSYLEQGPAIDRVDELERSRHQWEAMCEGLLQKAEGKLRAANNAEARERANKKSYERLVDPFPEDGVEPEPDGRSAVLDNDAPPSETERLHAVRLDVAPSNKTLAQRAKFGMG